MLDSLLTTKLHIPPTRPNLVHRSRLIKKLNDGLYRKLTMISAPAGFGKTTLVTEWLENLPIDDKIQQYSGYTIAWLSLDENDNDPTRFLTYLIAALKESVGTDAEFGKTALGMLQSSQFGETQAILTSFINEIPTIPNRIVFILDDYHLIEDQSIHEALTFLLENIPPSLHLVIATREDPNLPIARFRSKDQMTELRAADLRFTPAEAAEFLNKVMALDLSAENIAALESRTEGWIAGLQLAAISLQGQADTTKLINSFTGSHRLVLDYLIEEVLEQQPKNIQAFLLQTSTLERLSSSLCDALTGQDNSQEILEYLDQANLFIVPLDEERCWYRYHHLFAELLQQRLNQTKPQQIKRLHLLASKWYEQEDFPSYAIQYAFAAQDFERAADLAEIVWPAWSGSYQSITWFGWVKDLPDELVRARPVLSLSFAWAYLNAGMLEAAEVRLLDVERLLELANNQAKKPPINMIVMDEEQFQELPVSLATARAYHAMAIGNVADTAKYAQRAFDLLPKGDPRRSGDITALLGLSHWSNGDLEAAHRTFSDGLAEMDPLSMIVGTFVLADIKTTLGQLQEAIKVCEHALKLASEHDPVPIGTEDVYSGISEIHRELGNLEAAAQALATCKELGEQIELPDWNYRWCIAQARLDETLGDFDRALDLLEEAEHVFVRTPLPIIRPIPAMKARVLIKQGRLKEALGWVQDRELSVDDDLGFLQEFEHITLVRLLIAQYKHDAQVALINDAIELLKRLLHEAIEGKRVGSQIELLVLQALAHEAQSDLSFAIESLESALKLAEPEGYFRIFVDEGPPMARLLFEALSSGIAQNYSQQLLVAFPTDQSKRDASIKHLAAETEWIEPLSEREIEVLQLISEGLTNQEIADRLYLSLHTVKVHARNIYSKLSAKNRTQAVARGKALGILTPD